MSRWRSVGSVCSLTSWRKRHFRRVSVRISRTKRRLPTSAPAREAIMSEILDIAIIGYGPTAQMLSALLGARGHKVTAFERHLALYALPRASALDHEIARNLQWL